MEFSALIITVLVDTYDCTYELHNNWMKLEFSALDNVVRFHGFITFIVDTNECKALKNLPLLILT